MKAITFLAQTFHAFKPGNYDKGFIIEDTCNGCKVCEKVCPVNNIKVKDKPTFKHECICCYACTHNCPQNAIRLKSEKSKNRFSNEKVELKEIIAANN
jgi:MinD superfamily P-loop ATPase